MKLKKEDLKRIIREEVDSHLNERDFGEGEPPEGEIYKKRVVAMEEDGPSPGTPAASVGLGNLWRDLNILLERWPDKEHPYYLDLYRLLEDYSTSPDRPTRLPKQSDIEEGKKKGMFGQPDFKSKVAWVKRNKPEVDDPDAYVAGALRKAGELKEDKKHSVE